MRRPCALELGGCTRRRPCGLRPATARTPRARWAAEAARHRVDANAPAPHQLSVRNCRRAAGPMATRSNGGGWNAATYRAPMYVPKGGPSMVEFKACALLFFLSCELVTLRQPMSLVCVGGVGKPRGPPGWRCRCARRQAPRFPTAATVQAPQPPFSGSLPVLGNWEPARGVPMHRSPDDPMLWTTPVELVRLRDIMSAYTGTSL